MDVVADELTVTVGEGRKLLDHVSVSFAYKALVFLRQQFVIQTFITYSIISIGERFYCNRLA